jgi:hypothetical protein
MKCATEMMMHIVHKKDGDYTLVLQDEHGNRMELLCCDRQAAYQLGGVIAGAVEVHTKLEVEYL